MGKYEWELAWCIRWIVPGKFINASGLVKVDDFLVGFLNEAGLGELDRVFHGKSDRR